MELNDLAPLSPEQISGMKSLLESRLSSIAAEPREGDEEMSFDEETREQLRALGYLD